MENTREPSAKSWLFTMIKTLNHDDLTRCLVTLWAVWFARRKAIHEELFQSPLSTHCFVESFLRDLAMTKEKKKTPKKEEGTCLRWIAPPVGSVKINVDAAVRKHQNFGAVAAVCRAEDGHYLGASAVVIQGISDPATLEALACREALALGRDLLQERVFVATDCLEIVESMKESNLGRYSSVLNEIQARSKEFSLVRFGHEKRASNVEAHSLAKSSAYLSPGRHVWLINSPDHFCIPVNMSNE
jgi:ribonuclease HI